MKKIGLILLLPIVAALLSIYSPNLSPIRGGGDTFENIHPQVNSQLVMEEIVSFLESEDIEPEVKQAEGFAIITGRDIHLRTWYPTIEYFLGKELSSDFLLNNGFPDFIIPQQFEFESDRVIAVKIEHPDLTSIGIQSLESIMYADKTLDFQKKINGKHLFKYNDYFVLLDENVIYMYLNLK